MRRIKLFLEYNKSSRGSSLTEEEFSKILHSKCKSWLNNPSMFIRVKKDVVNELSLIDPKEYDRKSINDHNYITILMDNLPSWSELPKRSKSVIFSYGLKNNPGAFGNELYFVIPFDGSEFAVAPSFDLWGVINHDVHDYRLNNDLSDGFAKMGAPAEYSKFSTWANDKFSKNTISEFESDGIGNYMTRSIYIKYKGSDETTFMEWFDEISRPSNWYSNNDGEFEIMDYNKLSGDKGEFECWTDSKCLIYHVGHIPTTYDKDLESTYKYEFNKMVKSLSLI